MSLEHMSCGRAQQIASHTHVKATHVFRICFFAFIRLFLPLYYINMITIMIKKEERTYGLWVSVSVCVCSQALALIFISILAPYQNFIHFMPEIQLLNALSHHNGIVQCTPTFSHSPSPPPSPPFSIGTAPAVDNIFCFICLIPFVLFVSYSNRQNARMKYDLTERELQKRRAKR